MDALGAFRLVDLLGVAAGAAGGALAARRQDGFDIVGVLGLAFACGLDVLTARTPEIFRHGELNALAALAAASIFLVAGGRAASRRGDP